MPQQTLNARIRKRIPVPVKNLKLLAKAIVNVSKLNHSECNLCGYQGRFWPHGGQPRIGAVCGRCASKERHRLVGLWIDANPDVVRGARLLHFAPEPRLARLFMDWVGQYRSADLNPAKADMVLNIEKIDLPDESVDLVLCSHVLEHVDDAAALQEIHRILTPGGRALLMFPIIEGWDRTYENPVHTSPAERIKYYGQADHVRFYGRDVRDRIRGAGFELAEFTAVEPDVSRYGLKRGDKMFIAAKSS